MQVSFDGIAVISHDPDLQRLLGRAERIDELDFAELTLLDLGEKQAVPSLAEALARFPGVRFNIDIKSDAAVTATVAAILEAQASDRVLVTSFNNRRRKRALRSLPGVATSASAMPFAAALIAVHLGSVYAARRILRTIAAVQIPERFRGFPIISARVVRLLQRSGVEVHVWTVNNPTDMTRLLELGVDGLVTDRADLALQVLRNRRSTR